MRLTFILLLLLSAGIARGENPRDELKGVKQEIRAKKQLISKTRKVEAVVSTELQEINRNLVQKESDLGRLDRDLKGVESSLGRTGREIVRVTDEANRKKQEIERRLASLYKAGELGAVRMFFSAESFPQMAENIRYMRSILDNDKKIFAEYDQKIVELHKLKVDLERDAVKKSRIKEGIAVKKLEIEQEKSKKAAYLVKVRQDRTSYERSLKELQANAARLQTMMERLEALSRRKLSSRHEKPGSRLKPLAELPPVPDRGFASQKGRMSLPVRGEIIETYGKHKHPDFNSYTFSKGLSISAGVGSDIKSIYDGSVIFADYFKGFGNMIIIDHGGGYFSLYAHASKILKKVGAEVARNETVATVGDADSTKGPLLYFEIRHQGKPVDPAGWVR
ncbi:MAG: peptidoglycan DD-metalloendopeptidase family protein [Geobacteraceae bacterium]|nr:peptidoglycan DD-metalloendopeptidase family protein [Geobacteraceae bacterium]